jgi:hypothetical protein
MPPRCRVTFFDNRHQIRRTIEDQAGLPLVAAETALKWFIQSQIDPEDLNRKVKVEIIATTECELALDVVDGRAEILAVQREIAKAA